MPEKRKVTGSTPVPTTTMTRHLAWSSPVFDCWPSGSLFALDGPC